jgi:hypothetical protein
MHPMEAPASGTVRVRSVSRAGETRIEAPDRSGKPRPSEERDPRGVPVEMQGCQRRSATPVRKRSVDGFGRSRSAPGQRLPRETGKGRERVVIRSAAERLRDGDGPQGPRIGDLRCSGSRERGEAATSRRAGSTSVRPLGNRVTGSGGRVTEHREAARRRLPCGRQRRAAAASSGPKRVEASWRTYDPSCSGVVAFGPLRNGSR